jgi:arabinofuranosyltransferase
MIKPDLPARPTEGPRIPGRLAAALVRLAAIPGRYWRWMALGVLTLLSLVALFQASLVVDGTRYFWLDDDQMISMRYARNLAEGHGLVWNPGERVEGYTNFLWTLIMAAVHRLPGATDARAAIFIEIINWGLACAVLLLSERLLRFFVPKPGLALAVLVITLAVDLDVVYWSTHGFETTLLTAVFLLAVVRILEEWRAGRPRPVTYLLMGLLPLIRSDAYPVWAAAALLALGLSTNRRRTARLLVLSLLLPVLHLLFRHWYYGEWLPNTYYLKVAGVPDRTALGVQYLLRFLRTYSVPLGFATAGLWLAGDRRRWLLIAGLLVSGGYVLVVGEDLFYYSRYLAHLVPVVLVLAVVAVVEATRGRIIVQSLLLLILFAGVFTMIGATSLTVLDDDNGEPRQGLVTGLLIDRFTRPEATIAVVAAGNVSYFGRRYAIDLLGKSDPHIARLPAHPGSRVGHSKFDAEYSLGLRPDLVVPFWIHKLAIDPWAVEQAAQGGDAFIAAIVGSPTFRQQYLPHPIPLPYLMEHNSVYVRTSSPEMARRALWKEPQIGPSAP